MSVINSIKKGIIEKRAFFITRKVRVLTILDKFILIRWGAIKVYHSQSIILMMTTLQQLTQTALYLSCIKMEKSMQEYSLLRGKALIIFAINL